MNRREWTEQEDDILRRLAPTVSIQRLAVKVRRHNASVIARAKFLKISLKKAQRLSARNLRTP